MFASQWTIYQGGGGVLYIHRQWLKKGPLCFIQITRRLQSQQCMICIQICNCTHLTHTRVHWTAWTSTRDYISANPERKTTFRGLWCKKSWARTIRTCCVCVVSWFKLDQWFTYFLLLLEAFFYECNTFSKRDLMHIYIFLFLFPLMDLPTPTPPKNTFIHLFGHLFFDPTFTFTFCFCTFLSFGVFFPSATCFLNKIWCTFTIFKEKFLYTLSFMNPFTWKKYVYMQDKTLVTLQFGNKMFFFKRHINIIIRLKSE